MDDQTKAYNAFKKLDQMIEYREREIDKPEKSRVRHLIEAEIQALLFIGEQAKENLVAKGIEI